MRSDSAVYKLKQPCRALAAAVDTTQHLFLLGTHSVKGRNEIYLLEYKEDTSLCECLARWLHPYDIWSIAPCPSLSQRDLFATVHGTDGTDGVSRQATLWSKENGTDAGLAKLLTLGLDARAVVWDPQGVDVGTVQVATPSQLCSVRIDAGGQVACAVDVGGDDELTSAASDPHHADSCAGAAGPSVHLFDLRAKEATCTIGEAHPHVLSLEYNQNKQYHVLTGGDDGAVRLWDLRNPSRSMKELLAHDHWVTVARHNPSHEQLVLTGSTDRTGGVKLWNLPTPAAHSPPTLPADALLRTLSDFDDTVYGVAWSAVSPWVYASVSYNAKVAVHQVPRDTRYSILLSE